MVDPDYAYARWVHAFLRGTEGSIKRRFTVAAYARTGEEMEIVLDGSPFDMGAIFCIAGKPCVYYAIGLSAFDLAFFKLTVGDSGGQQVWGCYNCRIALRHWRSMWVGRRCSLRIRPTT